jgi:hypothetical protein
LEVTDATDRDATGDPEDAICRGLFGVVLITKLFYFGFGGLD